MAKWCPSSFGEMRARTNVISDWIIAYQQMLPSTESALMEIYKIP